MECGRGDRQVARCSPPLCAFCVPALFVGKRRGLLILSAAEESRVLCGTHLRLSSCRGDRQVARCSPPLSRFLRPGALCREEAGPLLAGLFSLFYFRFSFLPERNLLSESKPNRLASSASSYLRSAAHQPIDWHEWGDAAFARARAEDKPILLDIGAVWCHWCHVIDRESYENPEIAAIINRDFVAVKVDRDERPDVDARYQSAIAAISGQGGWPLTGFLTPGGKPFFGGTYFPPDNAMGRPGFRRILGTIADAYRTQRDKVEQSAAALADAVAKAETFADAKASVDPRLVDEMVDSIVRMFDLRNGGFGRAPKFPHPAALELLLERYQATREPHLRTVVENTLEQMALGGVYDQLAGGFHRYSVDERWLVPHFEKMSYDNSELLKNYLHAWQVTQDALFRETAEGIIAWVSAVLSDQARGGFYTSQDADASLDDDGDYFTWTQDEVNFALPPQEARAIELYYDVQAQGEMHHNPAKNVLWVAHTNEEVAKQLGRMESDVRLLLASARGKLLAARSGRPTPFVDATLYTGWNAMFVSAYLEAAHVLQRNDCREFALKTLDRLLTEAWNDAHGFAHRLGGPRLDGMIDDQVFAVGALLDAYEATLDRRYFDRAERAMNLALEKYWDEEKGGFFDRARDAAPLGGLDVRRKPLQDSPTPGANSIAAIVLDRLYSYTGNALYRERAAQTLETFAGAVPQFGLFAASFGLAALLHARHPMQIVVTGAAGDPAAKKLEDVASGVFRFGKAVLRVTPEQIDAGALAPVLQQTLPHLPARSDSIGANVPQALICVNASCQPPITDSQQLSAALDNIDARSAN
ncbi:MAG: thioredoxin domain-containing protein [Acidobacteria bacterium]|nr:thioredoxin domain-containing protein [Acidobacteriota bacterium]